MQVLETVRSNVILSKNRYQNHTTPLNHILILMSKSELKRTLSSVSSLVCKPHLGACARDKQDEPPNVEPLPLEPLPHVITSKIVETTQSAIEWYRRGAKLWRRYDLEQIERELANYQTVKAFTIRRIDGVVISIENPMHGIVNPIWYKPLNEDPNLYMKLITPYADELGNHASNFSITGTYSSRVLIIYCQKAFLQRNHPTIRILLSGRIKHT